MPKIDELKSKLDWMKESVKILVAILLTLGAGIAKLYLDGNIGALFIAGVSLITASIFVITVIVLKINRTITEIGELP